MNNGNMPANPLKEPLFYEEETNRVSIGCTIKTVKVIANGLTKREHFAAMAMQGICATYQPDLMGADGSDARICAKYAIEHADALLAALEKAQ